MSTLILCLWAFSEAFIFPIPPDPFLIALVLANKKKFFLFAITRAIKNGSGGIGKMKASENAQRHNINRDILLFNALFMFIRFLSFV